MKRKIVSLLEETTKTFLKRLVVGLVFIVAVNITALILCFSLKVKPDNYNFYVIIIGVISLIVGLIISFVFIKITRWKLCWPFVKYSG